MANPKKKYKRPSFLDILSTKRDYEKKPTVSLSNPQTVFIDPEFGEEQKLITTNFISIVGNFEITTEIENEMPVLVIQDADSYYKKIRIGFPSFDEFREAANALFLDKPLTQVNSHFDYLKNIKKDQILYTKKDKKISIPVWAKIASALTVLGIGGIVGYAKYKHK